MIATQIAIDHALLVMGVHGHPRRTPDLGRKWPQRTCGVRVYC